MPAETRISSPLLAASIAAWIVAYCDGTKYTPDVPLLPPPPEPWLESPSPPPGPSGPDDVYLALRGLRTLAVRLARHQETALTLAHWLRGRPEVRRVMHPGLPDDPGHEIWARDFTGSSGLFGVVLQDYSKDAISAMLDGMSLHAMGASWGGFESLILPTNPARIRTATVWDEGPTIRIHAGLEDPDDLLEDIERGLERLNAHG